MRIVAVQTSLAGFQRVMLELNGLRLGADIFVTFKTQLIAGFVKIKAVTRSMGIVAGDAIAFYDQFVGAARLLRYFVFVAIFAERCYI